MNNKINQMSYIIFDTIKKLYSSQNKKTRKKIDPKLILEIKVINQNYILGLIYNISSNFYESEGDIIDFASRVKNHENKTSLDILQEQFDCRLFKIKINEYTESSVIEVSTKIAKFIYSPIEEIINKQDNLRITNLN
jgi:hypothetical protein